MIPDTAFNEDRVLYFKNFPSDLNAVNIESLMNRLGAIQFDIFPPNINTKYYRILAEFKTQNDCWNIIKSLHQFNLLGTRICIRFAQNRASFSMPLTEEKIHDASCNSCLKASHNSEWIQQLLSISSKWLPHSTVDKLFYDYPESNVKILTNIARCMAHVPSFYTQVLHLMNRLNLPVPFSDSSEFPGSFILVSADLCNQNSQGISNPFPTSFLNKEVEEMEVSSGPETEMDSEVETDTKSSSKVGCHLIKCRYTPSLKKGIIIRKEKRLDYRGKEVRPNHSYYSNKSPSPDTHSPVFEEVHVNKNTQINVKLSSLDSSKSILTNLKDSSSDHGFGLICPHQHDSCSETAESFIRQNTLNFENKSQLLATTNTIVPQNVSNIPLPENTIFDEPLVSKSTYLTIEELKAGKLSDLELSKNPIFSKAYHPGTPSSRLYIKNLAKVVMERDLLEVFGSFNAHESSEGYISESNKEIGIQLLTSGKMKGQAFISFPSVQFATEALHATHGYVLRDRPMFVQFARTALAKSDPKSLING